MQHSKKYSLRLGVFITAALALFVIAIFFIGQKQKLFKSTIKITTIFNDVKGLKQGNQVRFTGIDVGTVLSTRIQSDTAVIVEMSIEESVTPFIKKNSIATIGTEGLMGSKIVIILPGTFDAPSIEKGDNLFSIEPVEIDDIMSEIKSSSEKITQVSENLISITNKINRGEGIFGKIFTDTSFMRNLDRTMKNTSRITKNLIEVSEKVKMGHGIVGKMFTDSVFSKELDSTSRNLNIISQNIEQITQKINDGQGVFGRLFADTSFTHNLYLTSLNLEESSKNLKEISTRMNYSNSVFNRLISDSALSDTLDILLYRLNQGVIEATEASEAIQNSGIIRMFSKDEKEKKEKSKKNDNQQ